MTQHTTDADAEINATPPSEEVRRHDGFRWIRWAREAHRSRDLTAAARTMSFLLADHADADGVCWPCHRRLVEESGRSLSTVTRGIRELRKAGWIEVESGTGHRGSLYRLVDRGCSPVTTQGVQRRPPRVFTRDHRKYP